MDDIEYVLTQYATWAVVGLSPSPHRDSHRIARLLQSRGLRIIPVNPEVSGELLGEPVRPRLQRGLGIEVVDLFRRSSAVSAHVDEAIEIGAKAVWMQLGVIDHAAAERARRAGLRVIMNRCPAIELPRLEGANIFRPPRGGAVR
jgi:predicted CoA-binding protein